MIYKPTHDNLRSHGTPILARLLVRAAHERSALTYGSAAAALQVAGPFSKIFSTEMGLVAGDLMDRIHQRYPLAPLLNVLLVRQDTRYPGNGAGPYLSRWFKKNYLSEKDTCLERPEKWSKFCDRAITQVYAFEGWSRIIDDIFGPGTFPAQPLPQEQDGRGGGEGIPHRILRLWAKDNPRELNPRYAKYEAFTEVLLLSGDRVDVVLHGPEETVCVEVKSYTSNVADLERGLYQCIKYRAVTAAMDARKSAPVRTMLVTQLALPGHLNDLAKLHDIRVKHVPHPLPEGTE